MYHESRGCKAAQPRGDLKLGRLQELDGPLRRHIQFVAPAEVDTPRFDTGAAEASTAKHTTTPIIGLTTGLHSTRITTAIYRLTSIGQRQPGLALTVTTTVVSTPMNGSGGRCSIYSLKAARTAMAASEPLLPPDIKAD